MFEALVVKGFNIVKDAETGFFNGFIVRMVDPVSLQVILQDSRLALW
ncbi:hypothetical protein NtB2_01642 [Lactococcus termiticola]|uniref:Uncharacterized protein n=1 Tax=Lactococcus termiticola TaxID=2169526 RepID=A0A2R5HHW4_9LACT|nr:hypothetical protein NtB2_01642 [Lactococcus termiticola]